jgi:hypothetical protein
MSHLLSNGRRIPFPLEVPVEPFIADGLAVLARGHFHMNAQILKAFGEDAAELAVGIHDNDAW